MPLFAHHLLHSSAVPSAATDSSDHRPLYGRGSMQLPAVTAADSVDASPGTVTDAGQDNQSDTVSETDEDLDFAEARWAAEQEEDALPFFGSSEDEEEDHFYFITTRHVLHLALDDDAGIVRLALRSFSSPFTVAPADAAGRRPEATSIRCDIVT